MENPLQSGKRRIRLSLARTAGLGFCSSTIHSGAREKWPGNSYKLAHTRLSDRQSFFEAFKWLQTMRMTFVVKMMKMWKTHILWVGVDFVLNLSCCQQCADVAASAQSTKTYEWLQKLKLNSNSQENHPLLKSRKEANLNGHQLHSGCKVLALNSGNFQFNLWRLTTSICSSIGASSPRTSSM